MTEYKERKETEEEIKKINQTLVPRGFFVHLHTRAILSQFSIILELLQVYLSIIAWTIKPS